MQGARGAGLPTWYRHGLQPAQAAWWWFLPSSGLEVWLRRPAQAEPPGLCPWREDCLTGEHALQAPERG
jgi:hypothetical protein